MEEKEWDIFISYASEDKELVARPLAAALKRAGIRVWLDEHELAVGDSLTEKIDEGLAHSQFGVVILSPAFLAKHWPRRELAGLRAREEEGRKVILPVWHEIDKTTISQTYPILADLLAANTGEGIDSVAQKLARVVFPVIEQAGHRPHRSAGRRLVEILESDPDKETLVDFLRFNDPDGYYLNWGSPVKFTKCQLFGMSFDAYALFSSHGLNLTLVSLTDVWKDPFEADREGAPRICAKITDAVSAMASVQDDLRRDDNSRINALRAMRDSFRLRTEEIIGSDEIAADSFWVEYFRVHFFLYAGRRSEIDANPIRRGLWTPLRNYGEGISVRTYDNLLDAFLPS
jgi:hypothetical protein